jgi:hypothetical protein
MTYPTTSKPPDAPEQYTLRFPNSWWHLDLDPGTRDASIRRRIEAQSEGRESISREQVDSLVSSTRKIAREAYAQGALQAAGMFQFLDDGSSLIATTVVLRVQAPEESSTDLSELLLPVAMKNAGNPLGRGTPANSVDVIELPEIGSVGRVTAIEDVDFQGKATVRNAMMHTIVPVPHSRDFLVISSTTPNLALVDEFFEVFDAISGTLRFRT